NPVETPSRAELGAIESPRAGGGADINKVERLSSAIGGEELRPMDQIRRYLNRKRQDWPHIDREMSSPRRHHGQRGHRRIRAQVVIQAQYARGALHAIDSDEIRAARFHWHNQFAGRTKSIG